MNKFKIFNATDIWQRETSLPSIPTFCQSLDKILGNDGIQLGSMTEIVGLPGTGKTQLCLQLCASVQIPECLGGLEAEALYIDTNTNFTITRFKEILFASLLKCQRILGKVLDISEEDALKKLHYVNAFGLETFCAFMYKLPSFLQDRPKIKIVVIDSIIFPFKDGISVRQRTGLLFQQMAHIQKTAVEKRIAMVLTNEMSTRIGLSSGSIVGALGDAWSHRCNARLLISSEDYSSPLRDAVLLKSNIAPVAVAHFQITEDGIRDTETTKN